MRNCTASVFITGLSDAPECKHGYKTWVGIHLEDNNLCRDIIATFCLGPYFYVFSDSVLCLGRVHQHPESNEAWKKRIEWIITDKSYRDHDGINGEPTEFEWNIFPGFTTLQLCGKVADLLSRLGEAPETFTGRILFMSMFNDISCDGKGNEEECVANSKVVSILAKKFGVGQWSYIGPGSEKKWSFGEENSPQGIWDHIADEMLLEFAESGCPFFRATTPFSRC